MAGVIGFASVFHRSRDTIRCAQLLHQKQGPPALRKRPSRSICAPSSQQSHRSLLHGAQGAQPPCLDGATSWQTPVFIALTTLLSARAETSPLSTAATPACGQQEEADVGYMRQALQLAEKVAGCKRPLLHL